MDLDEFIEERRRQKYMLIVNRRRLRDSHDPFDVTVEAFTGTYRLPQVIVLRLVDMLRPHYKINFSTLAVALHLRVLCGLSFFASGSYQKPLGKNFDLAISQPTVSVFVEELTAALNHPRVVCHFVRFPRTREEVLVCIERNRLMGGQLPRVVGYVDGTLVRMMKPSIHEHRQAFIGRKGFACMNVQLVCDRRMLFLNVLARYPGSTNDSFIFRQSSIRESLIELNAEDTCFLLGDSGYPIEPWILTPFSHDDEPNEDTPESRYNAAHVADRNVIERAIGVMCAVWRAVNSERALHYSPLKVCRFMVAATVLHNIRILAKVPIGVDLARARNLYPHGEDGDNQPDDPNHARLIARGRQARERVVQHLEHQREIRHQHQPN